MSILTDTSQEIEKIHVSLLQKMSVAKRIALVRSLSQTVIELSRKAILTNDPCIENKQAYLDYLSFHYNLSFINQQKFFESFIKKDFSPMSQPDILLALIPVISVFKELGVSYYIGGSIASSAYGFPRTTIDVDVITNLYRKQAKPLAEKLKDSYYADEKMISDAIARNSCFNLIHFDTVLKIDIFVKKNRPYDEEIFHRILLNKLSTEEQSPAFYFASPEDVILTKLEWYRAGKEVSQLQWSDVLGILKVKSTSLNINYLKHWSKEIGVNDLLEKILVEAGL